MQALDFYYDNATLDQESTSVGGLLQIIYFDGQYIPKGYAKLTDDSVVWRGRGVFEALEARGKVLFHFDDHYERLIESCRLSRIPTLTLLPRSFLLEKIECVLENNRIPESVVKIAVTRGDSLNDLTPTADPKLIIKNFPMPAAKDMLKLETQAGIRRRPRSKSIGEYDDAIIRREEAIERGFDDFLYRDPREGITEASLSNVFFVTRRNELVTPSNGVLLGVTRKIILALAKETCLFSAVYEKHGIHPFFLEGCREVFLTSTTLGVAEVLSIDGLEFAKAASRRKAEILRKMFLDYRNDYYKVRGA